MTLPLRFVLMIPACALTAGGQIFFKKAAVLESSFFRKFYHPVFLLGAFLFVCCRVISSLAAKVMDFSIMYATTFLNFVFVLLLSRWVLKGKGRLAKGRWRVRHHERLAGDGVCLIFGRAL